MKSSSVTLIDRSLRLLVVLGFLTGALGAPTNTPGVAVASVAETAAVTQPDQSSAGGNPANAPLVSPTPQPTVAPTAEVDISKIIPPGLTRLTAKVNATDKSENASVAQAGAVVSFLNGQVQVVAEAGAFGDAVDLVLRPEAKKNKNDKQPKVSHPDKAPLRFTLEATRGNGQKVATFAKPVRLLIDLRDVPGITPQNWYLAYQDDRDPTTWHYTDVSIHDSAGLFSATTTHFSIWAAGTGPAAWEYRWNPPAVSTFSAAAIYQYPIEVPPGRAGLTPNIDLSYSSRGLDGLILSDGSDQGPIGIGWSMNNIEITRNGVDRIDDGSHVRLTHPDNFSLALNGESYQLMPNGSTAGNVVTYSARNGPQLFIQRIYDATAVGANVDKFYWVVKTSNGTAYRLGYTPDAESGQEMCCGLILVSGHAGADTGTHSGLRWRVDTITDVSGNQIQYDYKATWNEHEDYMSNAGNPASSETGGRRITEIRYNFVNHAPNSTTRVTGSYASRIVFVGNGDNKRVTQIALYHTDLSKPYRIIKLTLDAIGHGGCGQGSTTNRVLSIQPFNGVGSGAVSLPATTFSYVNLPHWGTGCGYFEYIQQIYNGYGGNVKFTYVSDGREQDLYGQGGIPRYGQSYFVTKLETWDGINTPAAVMEYQYETPCYDRTEASAIGSFYGPLPGAFDCLMSDIYALAANGPLVGFAKTMVTNKDYTGQIVNKTVSQFHQDTLRVGRSFREQTLDANSIILQQTDQTWALGWSAGNPNSYVYLADTITTQWNGGVPHRQRTSYTPDAYNNTSAEFTYGAEELVPNAGFESAQEVMNAGFESGGQSWTLFGSPSPANVITGTAQAGQSSLQLTGANNGGAYQDLDRLVPGQTYFVTAWVKATAGATAKFNLWTHDTADGNTMSTAATTPSTTWSPVTLIYTANKTGKIRIHLYYTNGSGTIYVDEVSLSSAWNLKGVTGSPMPTRLTTDTAFAGRAMLQLQGAGGGEAYQDIGGLISGTTYIARAWITATVGATGQFKLWVDDLTGQNLITTTAALTNSWTLVSVNYTANATGKARLHLTYTGGAGSVYVDEVALAKTLDTGDERSTHRTYFYVTDNRWLMGLPWRENIYAGITSDISGSNLKTQSFSYYDGYTGNPNSQTTGNFTKGLVTTVGRGVWNTSTYVLTQYEYDTPTTNWGNLIKETDPNGHWQQADYDTQYNLYPVKLTNILGQSTTISYDMVLGKPLTVTDANNVTTAYRYDAFGRVIKVIKPGDSETDPTTQYLYTDGLAPFKIETKPKGLDSTFQFYDGLGRTLQARAPMDGGGQTVTNLIYDALSRAQTSYVATAESYSAAFSRPTGWDARPKTANAYDALGRTTVVTNTDGTTVKTAYVDATTQTRWTDTFSDGTLTGWTTSTGAGTVTEANGVLRLVGNNTWNTYASRPAGLQSDGESVEFNFKHDAGTVQATILLDNNLYGLPQYHRWGLYNQGTTISLEVYTGTTLIRTTLLTLTTGTWYTARLTLGGNGEFIARVWERDNPAVYAEQRQVKDDSWRGFGWRFLVDPYTNGLEIDDYKEIQPVDSGRLRTAVLDTNGHQQVSEIDASGQMVAVKEYTQTLATADFTLTPYATTRYTYDVLGNLTVVTDTANNTTSISYDGLGRKTGMVDPDMGAWSYGYDLVGNLTRQDDAKDQRSCLYYDELNRLKGKVYTNNTTVCPTNPSSYAVGYTYDTGLNGKGRRTAMNDPFGSAAWLYDVRGRVVTQTNNITDAGLYVTVYAYDSLDRVTDITYPTGEVVHQTYNTASQLKTVAGTSAYVTNLTYNALGQPTQLSLNNGAVTTYDYFDTNPTLNAYRLARLKTTKSGTTLLDFQYTYDNAGNIQSLTDNVAIETSNYAYDALDRLISATGAYAETYQYNAIGNMTSKAGQAYTYATAHPHAATNAGSNVYTYDANGNMLTRLEGGVTYTQTWDAENRLITVTSSLSGTTSFRYDGDGARVLQIRPDGSKTAYVGALLEIDLPAPFSPTATPTATSTPAPTATHTPTSTPTPAATATPLPIASGVAAYWKLDEATSGLRDDSIGSQDLTDNNTVEAWPGKLGYAGKFISDNSEYLNHADSPELSTGDINFTLAAWVYLENKSADRVLLAKWNKDTNNREYVLQYVLAADRFQLAVSHDGVATTSLNADALGSPTAGTWYLILAWHDAGANTLNIQVNDGSVNSVAYTLGVRDGTADFALGARKDTVPTYWFGLIDSVGLWKRVLTSTERSTLWNSGLGCDYPFTNCPTTPSGSGLKGEYYDNTNFTSLKVIRLDSTINFDWGGGTPDVSVGADTFSVRWTGQVMPRYSETYTFYTLTDDGVRLWVNNQLLVDKWVDQASVEWSGSLPLLAGQKYDIKLEYYENTSGAVAKFSWSSPSQAKEIIPASQLYQVNITTPTPPASSTNLALQATVTASSQYNSTYSPDKTIDGIVGQVANGEWAALAELNPWIQLTWASSQTINLIRLYDRVNLIDAANGGTLTFSDSSSIAVTGIPNDGTVKEISFANKTVTWVKFQGSGGAGSNVGLSEFQVFTVPSTATPTPTPTNTPVPGSIPSGQTWKVYYYANTKPIAMRVLTSASSTLYYLHGDHLGSTSLTTDASGNVLSRQKYYPYGQVRSTTGTLPTDIGFTSQRLDTTGLMFYNARYYNPTLGRFISADTIVPEAKNPQTLNRYAYGLNNPLKYTDPSGHCVEDFCIVEAFLFATLVYTAKAVDQAAIVTGADYIAQTKIAGKKEYEGFGCALARCGGFMDYMRDRGVKVLGVATGANLLTMGVSSKLMPGAATELAVMTGMSETTAKITLNAAWAGGMNLSQGMITSGLTGDSYTLGSGARDLALGATFGAAGASLDEFSAAAGRGASASFSWNGPDIGDGLPPPVTTLTLPGNLLKPAFDTTSRALSIMSNTQPMWGGSTTKVGSYVVY